MTRARLLADGLFVSRTALANRTAPAGRPVLAACFVLSLSLLSAANAQAQAFGKLAPANGEMVTFVNLGWSSFPLADHYEYCYSAMGGNAVDYLCEGHWVNVGKQTYVTLNGLTLGTTYYWQVRMWAPILGYIYADAQTDGTWSFWSFRTRPLCRVFSADPASATRTANAGSQAVAVNPTGPEFCLGGFWNATGNGTWLTVAPDSGYESGTVTVSWTANPGPGSRSGTATIAGVAFTVTQSAPPPPFTDEPLSVRATAIKAIHIDELRSRINAARSHYGLPPFTFWDVLTVGTMNVKAIHVTQMRTALNGAYTVAKRTLPTYTDPTLTEGMAIRGSHIAELRNAVKALEATW
jgi:hypothetical protein